MASSSSKLSNNCKGWKPSRRRVSSNQYSPAQQFERESRSILGKLTHSNAAALMPKICDLYNQVDDTHKLHGLLNTVFYRAVLECAFHDLWLDIFSRFISTPNHAIAPPQFKRTVSALCEQHFNERLLKPVFAQNPPTEAVTEWLTATPHRYALRSISEFIGRLISSRHMFVAYEQAANYLALLFQEDINDDNIEAICGLFKQISSRWQAKNREMEEHGVQINVVDSEPVTVDLQSVLLVHGYFRSDSTVDVPCGVMNICVKYYDAHLFITQCYQQLRSFQMDNDNSVRHRFLIMDLMEVMMSH